MNLSERDGSGKLAASCSPPQKPATDDELKDLIREFGGHHPRVRHPIREGFTLALFVIVLLVAAVICSGCVSRPPDPYWTFGREFPILPIN